MNIEQQIYSALLNNAGGNQSKIQGLSKPMLNRMRKGEGKTSFSKLFDAMFENGVNEITLKSEHTAMTFTKTEEGKKELTVTTKSLSV